jgi:integrase
MARQKYDIESRLGRRALSARLEPYWRRLAVGEYVGYRQSGHNPQGTWVARYRDEEGRQNYKALGCFDDYLDAEKAAREWILTFKQSGDIEPMTVALACRHYVGDLRQQGRDQAAKDADQRFARTVYGTSFGKIRISALRADHIKKWRDSFEGIKAKSVNRELTTLRAALNLAFKEGLIQTDVAWRAVRHLKSPEGESTRRDRWLNAEERARLIESAHPALAQLIKALLLTAARVGEIQACNVSHFDRKAGTLHIPSGKTGARSVPLSAAMQELCQEVSKDKLPSAPLFTDPDGRRWNKNTTSIWMREARRQAGLDDAVVMYSIRHTAISEMVQGGLDAFAVAKLAGTSTAMIDKHYGHLCADRTRAALDKMSW